MENHQSNIENIKLNVPVISPIHEGINRPFWSVMIPTYNCANYLVKTLKSVLEQDPGADQMDIEVVDDFSTKDDPEAVVREIGRGRVSFFRQPHNMGATTNFNTCIQRAKGEWVHILHGDDTVLPGFYKCLRQGVEKEPTIGAAFSRYIHMDENGHWKFLSWLERETPGTLSNFWQLIAVINRMMTPCIVVKRSVYEKLGGFNPELIHAADWEMWKRIAVNYPIWFEPQPLACYREHSASDTLRLMRSGTNIVDTLKAIHISESYFPNQIAAELSNKSRDFYAIHALNTARRMLLERSDIEAAINQIREGIKCSKSSTVMNSLSVLLTESESLIRVFASLLMSTKNEHIFPSTLVDENHESESKPEKYLRNIKLLVFPKWQQPEELLYEDLVTLLKNIIAHSEKDKLTLLIYNSEISEEDANLIISDILFNLLQQDDIDVAEEPEISLIGNLSSKEWEALLPQISARIALNIDNKAAILQAKAENIPVCTLENISDIKASPLISKSANLTLQHNKGFNIVSSLESKPRIDVVLQATGLHGWSCSRGWVNVLQREGLLNRAFTPIADWGANEPKNDDGLFEYLNNPQADIILLLGFDWHSQPLHKSLKWQEQWSRASIKKLAVLQECYSSDIVQQTPEWKQLLSSGIASTIACVDALVCHHEPDVKFLQKQLDISLPIIFLPFAIDPEYFRSKTSFQNRLNRAVFRGNIAPFFTHKTYSERRNFIEALSECQNVDLLQFHFSSLANPIEEVERYADELNTYTLLLNLPSMSPTLTARPFEIMACGGVLLQNEVIEEESNQLFQNWKHLVYYDPKNPDDLINTIKYLVENPEKAQKIAEQGHRLCYEQHTLSKRTASILDWVDNKFEIKTNTTQSVLIS